jgi:hypothetical protein
MRTGVKSGFATALLVGTLWTFIPLPGTQVRSAQLKRNAGTSRTATNKRSSPRSEYVGDAACARCHQEIVAAFKKTAHHLTSQPATQDALLGSFRPDANTMPTSNPNLGFQMDDKDGQFFQTAIWETPSGERTHSRRFDLVIGSGRNGQTYLFWDENQLFQLPVGYSTALDQ